MNNNSISNQHHDAWESNFSEKTSPNSGYVTTEKEMKNIISDYEISTNSKFSVFKSDKLFGKESEIDFSKIKFEVRWEDSQNNQPKIPCSGIPFVIIGEKKFDCHQGKQRNAKRLEKRKKAQKSKIPDHDFSKKKKMVQTSKKKDCPVQIKARHIIRFPDFKISEELKQSRHERDRLSWEVRNSLKEEREVCLNHEYHVWFPNEEEHRNHFRGEAASMIHPVGDEIKDFIQSKVIEQNVRSTSQMKLLLEMFIREKFHGCQLPTKCSKRFWPSNRDIRNHMAIAIAKQRNSTVDQAVVSELVTRWRNECPEDKFFLRLKEDTEMPDGIDCDDSQAECDELLLDDNITKLIYGSSRKFLYVHQTPWQQRLLQRYGNEICLLDATYRTTQYALPVYFLFVPTNVNYMTVGTFILESEDCASISEALECLKSWNPEWHPQYFMCDYADEEIKSIESVFTGKITNNNKVHVGRCHHL